MTILIVLSLTYFFFVNETGMEIFQFLLKQSMYLIVFSPFLALLCGFVYLVAKAVMF